MPRQTSSDRASPTEVRRPTQGQTLRGFPHTHFCDIGSFSIYTVDIKPGYFTKSRPPHDPSTVRSRITKAIRLQYLQDRLPFSYVHGFGSWLKHHYPKIGESPLRLSVRTRLRSTSLVLPNEELPSTPDLRKHIEKIALSSPHASYQLAASGTPVVVSLATHLALSPGGSLAIGQNLQHPHLPHEAWAPSRTHRK